MAPFIKYLQRLPPTILLCLFLVHCSNNSSLQQAEQIRVLDEIPQHIQEVENLSVFPADSEPSYSVELIPEQTYGETGEPYLSHIQGCDVDDEGRVIIWDIDMDGGGFPPRNRLYVYNPDGTYYTQIGRTGRGPGEFGMLVTMHATAGSVFVLDHTNKRMNVYNKNDYFLQRSTVVEQWSVRNHEAVQDLGFANLYTRNDGNHIAKFIERVSDTSRPVFKYLLIDTDGDALNFNPLVFPASPSIRPQSTPPGPSVPLPFMGNTIIALSGNNALYSAWTQDFLIKKYDPKGAYQSAIYYPVKGSTFDLSDYTEKANYNQQDVMNALDEVDEELPESNPVIADLKVDDENRIWVAVPTGVQGETYEWWILEESGALLAKLLLPSDQPIYDINNGYLYSKKTNEETGTEYAVRYRIKLTEK